MAPPTRPAETVSQTLISVATRDKRKALRTLLQSEEVENALIFCNRKKDVDLLNKSLRRYEFSSAALHGDMAQSSRTETLAAFKAGEIKLLVATDVAGRGLDIVGLSHVFNFDVPIHAEDYIHRIGRTGRAGREGQAVTLAVPEDGRYLADITKLIGKSIPTGTVEGLAPAVVEPEAETRRPPRSRRPRKPAQSPTVF